MSNEKTVVEVIQSGNFHITNTSHTHKSHLSILGLKLSLKFVQNQNTSLKKILAKLEDENDSDQEQSNEEDNSESLVKVHGKISPLVEIKKWN